MTVNGKTLDISPVYKGTFDGIFNFANYCGVTGASTSGGKGKLAFSGCIAGFTFCSLVHDITLAPIVNVFSDHSGNLNYSPSGSFGKADGVVGIGFSYTVEGIGTHTLTFHLWGSWALNATQVSGIGGGKASASISFANATKSDGPVALGTYIFQE